MRYDHATPDHADNRLKGYFLFGIPLALLVLVLEYFGYL